MNGNGDNGRNGLARVAIRCQSDSRLVKLVREGHDLAFDEVVRRYRPQLVAYAAAIVPEHHAEDVVQEALTRAHTALGRSDSEMRLRPWLYTIVRNGALNALRDEPVHTHLDENYDGVPQPPEVAARREELAELTASVNDLPDQQREALVKRELEGRSHEEIGVSLGVSAGAVRGLIYRARATLRDGAGMVIPLPVLRALLSSSQATPETTGAAGAAAAGLAGGGGGIALKAGATLGVAVIAVGSGIAVQHRDSGSAKDPATGAAPVHSARADGTGGSGGGVRLADAALPGGRASGQEGEGSPSSGPGGGRDGSSGSSSGPGSGGHSGGGGSPGPGPGTDHGGHSGSGSGGDDGTGSSSGPGGGGRGDDGGGSTTSGHDGSGSSGSGGGDDGTSGGGGGEISGHDGGSSGSGSSGSGGDGGGTSGGSSGDDGSSGSGSGSSGSGSGGSGSGDDGGSTTTATTTTDGGGGGGTSGGSD
jgi:RNA polymerase sigma factor (sigma-70 family)